MEPNNIQIQTVYRIFTLNSIQGLMGGQSIKGLDIGNNAREFPSEADAYAWLEENKVAMAREVNAFIILPTYRARHL